MEVTNASRQILDDQLRNYEYMNFPKTTATMR